MCHHVNRYIFFVGSVSRSALKWPFQLQLSKIKHLTFFFPSEFYHIYLPCRSPDKLRPLQRAIARHLPVIVETLCKRGADMDVADNEGNCPLWQALETGQEDVALILVRRLGISRVAPLC